jgi:hypothetical protein
MTSRRPVASRCWAIRRAPSSTSDVGAARDWYGELFDWTYEEMDGADGYQDARNRDGWLAAGLTQLPVPGVTPAWGVSFSVADVAVACERAEELGGSTILPRTDTPVGDIAVVSDPQGRPLTFFAGDTEP